MSLRRCALIYAAELMPHHVEYSAFVFVVIFVVSLVANEVCRPFRYALDHWQETMCLSVLAIVAGTTFMSQGVHTDRSVPWPENVRATFVIANAILVSVPLLVFVSYLGNS